MRAEKHQKHHERGHPAMSSSSASRGTFFGWWVTAGAFVLAVFGWGLGFYGPPVFLGVLHETRGWPLGLISAAITLHYLVGAALAVHQRHVEEEARRPGPAARPARWPIIGPRRNVDAWHKAFYATPAAKYYLKPEDRTRIW